jgi:hypothetical protein
MFTLCQSRDQPRRKIASIAIDDLKNPPEGDVERTLRYSLGLTSTQDVMKHRLGEELKVKMVGKDVKFHLSGETCAELRDIEDLTTIALMPDHIVKVHMPSAAGAGTLAMGDGGDDDDDDVETDED